MKRLLITLLLYAAALAAGIGLFFACRPYALSHRIDKSLPGGEYLLIPTPPAAVMVVRTIIDDKKKGAFNTKDEDDED